MNDPKIIYYFLDYLELVKFVEVKFCLLDPKNLDLILLFVSIKNRVVQTIDDLLKKAGIVVAKGDIAFSSIKHV